MKTVEAFAKILSPSQSQCLKGGAGPSKPRPPVIDIASNYK